MAKIIKGDPKIAKGKIAIVVAQFNEMITGKLLKGAEEALSEYGVAEEDITVVWVPGSFEIPVIAKKLCETKEYGAVVCLGAIIRGDTYHFEMVAEGVTMGINSVAIDTGVPVIFGVITTENMDQAIARTGSRNGNKGWEAAVTALEMINVIEQL